MDNINSFISTKYKLPDIGELVWLYNSKNENIYLGTRELIYDNWMWSVSYGSPYIVDDKIVADIHIDSAYDFDYWCYVPKIPKK